MRVQNENTTAKNNDNVCEDLPNKTSDTMPTALHEGTAEPQEEWCWQDSGIEMAL